MVEINWNRGQKNATENTKKTMNWFSEKINKIDKALARLRGPK